MEKLEEIEFKNEFVHHFDGDDSGSNLPRQTPGVLYSSAIPTPVKKVEMLAWSNELASEMEIYKPTVQNEIDILGGNPVAA